LDRLVRLSGLSALVPAFLHDASGFAAHVSGIVFTRRRGLAFDWVQKIFARIAIHVGPFGSSSVAVAAALALRRVRSNVALASGVESGLEPLAFEILVEPCGFRLGR
jgi:hypothetical protein